MPSIIEEVPFKIWEATKRMFSICYQFLKNWIDKKNREEFERRIRQELFDNGYFLSNQLKETFGKDGVKKHFQYRIEPVYKEREVQNDEVTEYRKVQVDEEFYPIFLQNEDYRVFNNNLVCELHYFQFNGRLEKDVLVNIKDRWQAKNVGKEVKVSLLQIDNVKYLVFASFVQSYRHQVSKYFFDNRVYD